MLILRGLSRKPRIFQVYVEQKTKLPLLSNLEGKLTDHLCRELLSSDLHERLDEREHHMANKSYMQSSQFDVKLEKDHIVWGIIS